MTLTPNLLAILSLSLLALGLLVGAGALVASEMRRARSGKVIGRAIRQVAAAPDESGKAVDPAEAEEAAAKADIELPFHWLDSRFGRALVADEDRNLIDQCGLASKRTQLVFLVTRVVLAVLLPFLAYVGWAEGHVQRTVVLVLGTVFFIGFMAPKWVLGRIAAGRRERANQELPLFIDLLRLLQGVGLSLDQSLQIMATDFSHVLRVLGYELNWPTTSTAAAARASIRCTALPRCTRTRTCAGWCRCWCRSTSTAAPCRNRCASSATGCAKAGARK
jgi:tight adherence protein C